MQPVKEISELLQAWPNCHLHVDATQAVGKIPVSFEGVDTMSLTAHKFYGLNGIGLLLKRRKLALEPLIHGGESTTIYRSGTPTVALAASLETALEAAVGELPARTARVKEANAFLRDALSRYPKVHINSPENAVPEVLNFSEMCIKSETMLAFLAEEQIYVSSASACGRGQPSHTLAAMGRDPLAIDTAIRVSFCADNTPEDVDAFLNRFEDGMKHLQKIRK